MTNRNAYRSSNGLVLGVTLAAIACGGSSPGKSPASAADAGTVTGGGTDAGSGTGAGPDGGSTTPDAGIAGTIPQIGTFQVQWSSRTTFVDQPQLVALTSEDDTTHTYVFDAAAASAAGLDLSVGRVLVIYGKALRSISTSTSANGRVTVETAFATFEDAITEGTLDFTETLTFDDTHMQQMRLREPATGHLLAPVFKDKTATFNFALGELSATLALTTKGQTLAFSLSASNAQLKLTADGEISQFNSSRHIVIHDGQLAEYGHTDTGQKGNAKLTLTGIGPLSLLKINVKPDLTFLEFPVLVGPVPLIIKIGIQAVFEGLIPIDGSSRVETAFDFNTDTGFHYDGTKVDYNANLLGLTFTAGTTQTGASSPIGVNWGINFPKYSMTVFGELVEASFAPGFLIGGSFTPFFPPCQTADADFLVSASASLKLFTIKKEVEFTHSLLQQKKELLRAGQCPPG